MQKHSHQVSPQTKYEITAEEFINAAKGGPFKETTWFYRKYGSHLKIPEVNKYLLYSNQVYIIVRDSKILPAAKSSWLSLIKAGTEKWKPAFIFYNCIFPDIDIQNCKLNDWFFVRSVAGKMLINNDSEIGNISLKLSEIWGHATISGNSTCGYFWVKNSKIETVNIEDSSKCVCISITDGSVCGNVVMKYNSQVKQIAIDKNSRVANIFIINHCKCGPVAILNDSMSEIIFIADSAEADDIIVHDNSIASDIVVKENSKVKKIEVREQSHCGNISILANSESKSIEIERRSQTGNISIKNSRVIQLSMSENFCNVYLYNAIIPLMRFVKCCMHELEWSAGTKGELYIDGGKINHLKLFKTAILKDAVFSLSNVQIFIVQLQELLVLGQLVFKNIASADKPFVWEPAIGQLIKAGDGNENLSTFIDEKAELIQKQEEFYESGLQSFYQDFYGRNVPLFCIINSSLGKAEITGSDLSNFHFEYRDSKLLETFFSGTKLPKENIKIFKEKIQDSLPPIVYFEQKVSIYNQLKKIFENQGDIVEATWYHAKAMDNQEKLLKLKYKADGNKWFSEQWFDLKRFWLNKISNNHGESWRLALVFILIISLGFYSIYYLSLHYREPFSFRGTDRFLSNYLLFLDPTHKIDFHVPKDELGFLPVLFDFLSRILIAYGIYQFIAAFRKHTRKAG